MSYSPDIEGLVPGRIKSFALAYEKIRLAPMAWTPSPGATPDNPADGREVEGARQDASFTYDDTAFGAVPAGIFHNLATCAGQLAQLVLQPVQGFGSPSGIGGGGTFGHLEASMAGIGPLQLTNPGTSAAANALVITSTDEYVLLLRPEPVTPRWPGRLDANEALRTLWLPSEIGPVTYTFSMTAADVVVNLSWQAIGWNVA